MTRRITLRRAGGGATAVAGTLAVLALATVPVAASHGGSGANGNNRGDAWVDAAGAGQTGHENDPHMGCPSAIAIWGAGLNDASGPFTIQGWPPSGQREVDWSGTWHYDTAAGGSQVIATVPTAQLLAAATGNGDTAQAQQGFHFKLDLEDPRTGQSAGDDKYKVFWIDCGTSPAVQPATSTPTPTPAPEEEEQTPTPTPSGGVGGFVVTPTPTPAGGVQGLSTTTSTSSESSTGTGVGSGVAGSTAAGSGAAIPFTGAALPFELAGALGLAGLGLVGLSRRRRSRR